MISPHIPLLRPTVILFPLLLLCPEGLPAQGFKWWQDENAQRKLELTADQSRRIEDIFQSVLPELRRRKRQLDSLEQELSRLVESAQEEKEDTMIALQVDRVEEARAELNKARTLMLLRIRRVLTPEQRAKLSTTHHDLARQRSGRRKPH